MSVPGPLPAPLAADALVRLVQRLVRIPSVNPDVTERAMANAVRSILDGSGAVTHEVEHAPGRPSVAAVLDSGRPGPVLVLNGHLDTVPVGDADAWTTDPFAGALRDGHVYGRGACDMKGGLACQIAAAQALVSRGGPRRGRLVLHFAAGEERAEPGTLALCEAGFVGDVGVVTEPTALRVAVAERGAVTLTITLRGRSAHASRRDAGANPIDALPAVLEAVAVHERERGGRHPLLPRGTCTPTVIRGGAVANAVADSLVVLCDRRILPGQTLDGEVRALRDRLAALALPAGVSVELERAPTGFEPAEIPAGSPFAARIVEATARATGAPPQPPTGTPFSSDVHVLVAAGVEAVTFGPGRIEECHCADERVAVADLETCARVLWAVAEGLLG